MRRPMPPPACTPRARASAAWSSWCSRKPSWQALDIATGAGHTAAAFAPHVARVIASDLTEEMLQEAAKLAAAKGFANMETARADAEALPFEDARFDLVTCRIAAHHFPDVPTFVAEVWRVLKPRRHASRWSTTSRPMRSRRRAFPAPSCAMRRSSTTPSRRSATRATAAASAWPSGARC